MEENAMHLFEKQKKLCLSTVDLSKKGSIDSPICDLVHRINEQPAYFTTSSCSGRVCVFEENNQSDVKKKGCRWLYTTHAVCSLEDVVAAVHQSTGDAFFKFEPFVLHVQCRSLEDAQAVLSAAVGAGFRNSGISIGKKGKVITAVRSTHSLEVPLTHQGETLVSVQYLEYTVKLAEKKMKENLGRISRFKDNLERAFDLSRGTFHTVRTPSYVHKRKGTESSGLITSLVTKQPITMTSNDRYGQIHVQSRCKADVDSNLPDKYFSLFDGDP